MNKAIFLDRDGVINRNSDFVNAPTDIDYIPGVFQFCRDMVSRGFKLIVVTNQGGIATGKITAEAHEDIKQTMLYDFAQQGCPIRAYYHCPHHPLASPRSECDCECRKPKAGMILRAAKTHDIDLAESHMIGDNETDMQAGRAAGIPENSCHLFSGVWPTI